MKTNPDDPAMPCTELSTQNSINHSNVLPCLATGLTKREVFAMAAMQGLLSNPNVDDCCASYAKGAVKFADTLIAALNAEDAK